MSCKSSLASLGLFLILAFAMAAPASAQGCSRKMGPYFTIYSAETAAQLARNYGYRTSPVYGVGGLYSNYSNRRWWFNVFFPC